MRSLVLPVLSILSALASSGCQPEYAIPQHPVPAYAPALPPAAPSSSSAATTPPPAGTPPPPPAAAPAAPAPTSPRPSIAEGSALGESKAAHSTIVSLDPCRRAVTFSAGSWRPAASQDSGTVGYDYEAEAYAERASCRCRPDIGHSTTQFDAVDDTRRDVERGGYTLERVVFAETPAPDKELAYEASSARDGGRSFLVGRAFYGACTLTVTATGSSYADLIRAKAFLASATAERQDASNYAAAVTTAATASDAAPPETSALSATPDSTALPPAAPAASAPTLDRATASSDSLPSAAARFLQLKDLLDRKLITPEEYEGRRRVILDAL